VKVTDTRDGDVVVDTHDAAEAAAFVRELHDGKGSTKRRRRAPAKKALELESEDIPLSPALVETWNWLVAHDDPDGQHSSDVAAGLGINEHTSLYRLNKLIDRELAHRIRPGRYRAGG
jgi:hypothetical protein